MPKGVYDRTEARAKRRPNSRKTNLAPILRQLPAGNASMPMQTCERLRATLTVGACAKRWELANVDKREAYVACKGCDVGEGNAKPFPRVVTCKPVDSKTSEALRVLAIAAMRRLESDELPSQALLTIGTRENIETPFATSITDQVREAYGWTPTESVFGPSGELTVNYIDRPFESSGVDDCATHPRCGGCETCMEMTYGDVMEDAL